MSEKNQAPDKYEKIAKRMGVTYSEEMEKILKALFTPEEAEILLVFNGPYMDRLTAPQIAKKLKRPVEEVEPILTEMARTQRVFSVEKDNKRTYSMFPLLPGLFELYFSNYKRAEAEENEILQLFTEEYEKYYNKGYLMNFVKSSYPLMRVFVDQKVVDETVDRGKGKTIDLNEEITDQVMYDILPFEQAKYIIQNSRRISIMDCACRTHMKIHNQGVPVNNYPFNVCMSFNITADYCIEQGFGTEVTKERCLEILTESAKAGLVHTTQNVTDKSLFICNCDRDCCVMLRGIPQFNNPNVVAKSNFIPKYDKQNCIFCKKCTELCPLYAIQLKDEDTDNQRMVINYKRCIGCGVCSFNCEQKAITMVKKYTKIPAQDLKVAMRHFMEGRTQS